MKCTLMPTKLWRSGIELSLSWYILLTCLSVGEQCLLAATAEVQAEDEFVHFGVLKTILMEQLKVIVCKKKNHCCLLVPVVRLYEKIDYQRKSYFNAHPNFVFYVICFQNFRFVHCYDVYRMSLRFKPYNCLGLNHTCYVGYIAWSSQKGLLSALNYLSTLQFIKSRNTAFRDCAFQTFALPN